MTRINIIVKKIVPILSDYDDDNNNISFLVNSVKEAALYSLLLIYILHIDLIRNVMHNIYTYVH